MKYNITLNIGDEEITFKGTDVNKLFEEISYKKAYKELESSGHSIFKWAKDDYFISYDQGKEYLIKTKKDLVEIANKYLDLKKELELNILSYPLDNPESYELFNQPQISNPEPKEPILPTEPNFLDEPKYPKAPDYPQEPNYLSKPVQPQLTDKKYQFNNEFLISLFGNGILIPLEEYYKRLYKKDIIYWERKISKIESENERLYNNYKNEITNLKKKYENQVNYWNKEVLEINYKNEQLRFEQVKKIEELKKKYDVELSKWNENSAGNNVDDFKLGYFKKENDAVIKYFNKLLDCPDFRKEGLIREFFLKYNHENQVLEVMYFFPDCVTDVKEIRYIKSKNKFQEIKLPEKIIRNNYEYFIYKITLRTLYELFAFDESNSISAVIFNGYVKSIDKSTGIKIQPCILSIMVTKEEFLALNLNQVDVKACFKKLKGISANRLYDLTPIAPIISFTKNDKRFIPSFEIQGKINSDENIAAMDWEDFEHLVREIFEKEFSINGGEVKVTRASRDGGVDAIAFDPDPIRGGKIVIQAKRYTNTVGVSAVRDLYGTVLNEGATKGILVSTSNYGNDAYEFARGKPITLLNGSNLLYLLEKHGYRARIDLDEAKQILNENSLSKR